MGNGLPLPVFDGRFRIASKWGRDSCIHGGTSYLIDSRSAAVLKSVRAIKASSETTPAPRMRDEDQQREPDDMLVPALGIDEELDDRGHADQGQYREAAAEPRISRTEQPSSKLSAIWAARSGGRTGTLYSLAKSWTVRSQFASRLAGTPEDGGKAGARQQLHDAERHQVEYVPGVGKSGDQGTLHGAVSFGNSYWHT